MGTSSLRHAAVITLALLAAGCSAKTESRADDGIKATIVRDSIAKYRRGCPCPYSLNKEGKACDRKSAYSQGYKSAPLCYPRNVTKEAIAAYRAEHQS